MTRPKPKVLAPEVREWAVRLMLGHQAEYETQWAAIRSVAEKIGCSAEAPRTWVRGAERDTGARPGLTTDERDRLKALEAARAQRDETLRTEIRRVWDANRRAYSVRKVWHQLRREGQAVTRHTVEPLMRAAGFRALYEARAWARYTRLSSRSDRSIRCGGASRQTGPAFGHEWREA